MKRICSTLLAVALCLSLSLPVFAAEGQTVQVTKVNGEIVVNGVRTRLQLGENSSRSPLRCGGTVYITLMAAGQWLGADVTYNEKAKTVTIAHNGKEPVYYATGTLREMGVVWDDWEGLESLSQQQSAYLLSDVSIAVDGEPQSFFDVAGSQVYPLQYKEYILLPVEVVAQLQSKVMLHFPNGFLDQIYLYDPPTQEEYNGAKAYLANIRGHLDAVYDALKGETPKTDKAVTDKVREVQGHVKAIWTEPAPAFAAMSQLAFGIQLGAEVTLWGSIDGELPEEEYSGAYASVGGKPTRRSIFPEGWNTEMAWQFFKGRLVKDAEKKEACSYFLELEQAYSSAVTFISKVMPPTQAEVARPTADPTAYTDAKDIAHWRAVASMTKLGVVKGKDDGSFDPAGNITRAEAAKMLFFIAAGGHDGDTAPGAEVPQEMRELLIPTTLNFSDITGHWAEKYINWCSENGYICGRGDGTFDPDGSVTALELCKMVLCELGYNAEAYRLNGVRWAEMTDMVARTCAGRSLYTDLEGVQLDGPVSRDNAAQILYNALCAAPVIIKESKNKTNGETTWIYATDETRPDGEPLTLLYYYFGLEDFPTVPAQPTV